MNNNLPKTNEESLFTKVKNWFKKLFNINEPIQEKLKTEEVQVKIDTSEMKKNKFAEELKVDTNDKILLLQHKLEMNDIEISDLSDEELDKMIELYKEQIQQKKEKLKKYKKN